MIGDLPPRKSGMFAKTIFYFFEGAKDNMCELIKVPATFVYTAEESYVSILKESYLSHCKTLLRKTLLP